MKTQRGFNILELMTVVALTAILVTLGLPGFRELLANNRLTSQLNLLSSSLTLARSEAVKTNLRVVVCPSSDGVQCESDVDWNIGWLTFVDRGGTDFDVDDDGGGNPGDDPCAAGAGDDAADDCILSYVPALEPASMTLKSTASNDYIAYNGLGASNEAAMFVLCDIRGDDHAKAVVVSNTGRVSVRTSTIDGSALTCTP